MAVKADFINRLANHIEASPFCFDMTRHKTCIMGHAHRMEPELIKSPYDIEGFEDAAGLTYSQSSDVVYVMADDIHLEDVKRTQAVGMLRVLANTGKVVW